MTHYTFTRDQLYRLLVGVISCTEVRMPLGTVEWAAVHTLGALDNERRLVAEGKLEHATSQTIKAWCQMCGDTIPNGNYCQVCRAILDSYKPDNEGG